MRHFLLVILIATFSAYVIDAQNVGRFPRAAPAEDTKDTKDRFKFDELNENFTKFVEDVLKKKIAQAEEEYAEWRRILDEKAENYTSLIEDLKNQLDEKLQEQKEALGEKKDQLAKDIDDWKAKIEQYKADKEKKKQEQNEKRKKWFDEWKETLKDKLDKNGADVIDEWLKKRIEEEHSELEKKKHTGGTEAPAASGSGALAAASTILPGGRASLIDELTGRSPWQTMAWVLLILCIILAAGLIVIIILQVVNRKKNYQRLDGRDNPRPTEAEPIFTPASSAPRYTEKPQTSDVTQQF